MQVSRDTRPTSLRFVSDIRNFFKEEANSCGRSFNSEIMQALKNEMESRIEKKKQKQAA
ncbi:MAG: Arc family DNA-binding protein [Tolumonas sp.]|nr:Arc family DNA-binding protein [Tolumonas sp.]